MSRFSEAFLITVLGTVFTIVSTVRLCAKVLTIGLIPRDRFTYVLDDLVSSLYMTRCGVAHIFVEQSF